MAAAYDVAVIGGSLSGAAAALLVRKRCPGARVVVIEKSEAFGRRVGEATVEISGYFLGRVLGLAHHLNERHLTKQGMRFWFANREASDLGTSSELGGKYQVRLPSWQVDRAVLDEELLARAREAGAEVVRPAQVLGVELEPGGVQRVRVKEGGEEREIAARWVIDASGVAALLARANGWWQANDRHPTSSAWCRWRGVKDWDGLELAERFPEWARATFGSRHTATNHVVGDGWWSWWIPLKGGDMSIGVVFDRRLVDWPEEGGSIPEKLKAFLSKHPVGAELLERAEPVEGDAHWRKQLAYRSDRFTGDGFALVGDAAAFMDPLYSPGMDWITFTVSGAVGLVERWWRGEPVADAVAERESDLSNSYNRWFEAVYCDKYEYLGDFELFSLAFRMDLGLYYLGVVSQPFRMGPDELKMPPFARPVSLPFYWWMRAYNRRIAAMARERRRRGVHGRRNAGRRLLIPGFTLSRSDLVKVLRLAARWGWLELTEGWRSWMRPGATGVAPAR
jgi:flavin-dependent dehydrogenase